MDDAAEATTRHLTFLFADVEGSTRMAEGHGAAAGAALARCHEIAEACVRGSGGRIFERIGDGAYAAFDDACAAMAAAAQIQARMTAADWGPSAACTFGSRW